MRGNKEEATRMTFGKCKDCKKVTKLTKHSEIGHHIPPYIRLCEECHDKRHGIIIRNGNKIKVSNEKLGGGANSYLNSPNPSKSIKKEVTNG